MSEEHLCPRRVEGGSFVCLPEKDTWREDGTCSYCGSLNPKTLMARLEAGNVKIGPTDKNYKLYVENAGGEGFKQTYRACPPDEKCAGPAECTHWVTRDASQTKFYFQHFDDADKQRFVELLNEKRLNIGYPGYFYVAPFFVQFRAPA